MNFRRRERHRATNIFNLDPSAAEIAWPFKFRDDAQRALLHHLRNEFMRIEQFAAHRNEQTSTLRLARVVGYIANQKFLAIGQGRVEDLRNLSYVDGFFRYSNHVLTNRKSVSLNSTHRQIESHIMRRRLASVKR